MENKIDYNEQKKRLIMVFKVLSTPYTVTVAKGDPAALEVSGITEREHQELCASLGCSGHYSDVSQSGFLLNFGLFN